MTQLLIHAILVAALTGSAAAQEIVLAADPSWLVAEGDPGQFHKTRKRIVSAAELTGRTPTGKALAPTLTSGGGRVILRTSGSFMVSDAENAVIAGPEFVDSYPAPILVPLFAHELEHLVQGQAGITGPKARGARELGAFLVQCRVWVESGAPIRDADWERNGANSRDMWAWLQYPHSAMAALAIRADLGFDISRKEVRAYWLGVLRNESAWRNKHAGLLPNGRDGKEAALFILEQAVRFHSQPLSGAVSQWLPDFLEAAANAETAPALPPQASPKDKALFGILLSIIDGRQEPV